jgi:enamine deaminase RidA (YjgF/YER057c/UK114 family)
MGENRNLGVATRSQSNLDLEQAMKILNPENVVKPASSYAQGVVHAAGAERIVVSGQLGLRPDGTLEVGLEAQMERAWSNLFAVMAAGGFDRKHLLRATIYVTVAGQVAVYRKVRDRMLEGHLCANTYLEVSALAAPEFLVEIEAEAVRE